MSWLKFGITSLITGLSLISSAEKVIYKSSLLDKKIKILWRMEKLVSKVGETEQFRAVDCDKEGIEITFKKNKLPLGAVEFAFVARNKRGKNLYLRPLITVDVPDGNLNWWNGYNNMRKLTFDPCDTDLANWFPASAAYNKVKAVVVGINPIYLYSRIDSGKLATSEGNKLFLGLPFVLEPSKTFKYSFVVSACRSRYGYRDIVQHWYDIFPEAFNPADGINPDVISGESSYMYWKPETVNEKFVGDFIRRLFNGRGSWEWCYKPFVRGGDWAITDKWSVGWHGWTKEKVDEQRKRIRARLKPAEFLGIAPMWYLNVSWTEWEMWEKHFSGICPEKKPRKRHCWSQDTLYGVYSWGNDYAKLFMESINRIPKEYPASKGIAWDSCFGHKIFYEGVDGVKNTEHKSFQKGRIFALEGAGIANLLDLNHKNFSGKYRMANAVNFKLVSPYMVGIRSDVGLYEGNPIRTSNRQLRIESMRARLGTRKALVWHKGALPKDIRWIDWEDMEPAEARDVYGQLLENILFCNYYWGAVSAPLMPTIGVEELFKSMPQLVDLIRQGWQPSPGIDAHKDLFITRYGKGVGSRVVVINPRFKTIKTKLFFRADYWNGKALLLGREDGGIFNSVITSKGTVAELTLPPRKIVIIRTCGAGDIAGSGITDLTVKSQKIVNVGKVPLWRFSMNTNDKINWQVQFYRNSKGARIKLRGNNKRHKFSGDSTPVMKLASAEWPDDIQVGVKRSALVEMYEYPVYSTEKLTDETIRDLKLIDNIKAGKLAIVVAKDAPLKVKNEAARIAEWFRFYTNATGKRYYEPEITDSPKAKDVSIKLEVNSDRLKEWENGTVKLVNEKAVSINARNESEMRKIVLKFLGRMDDVYPYYGKLPKSRILSQMGLAGKTLKLQKVRNVFHPTLLEMFRKTGVKK